MNPFKASVVTVWNGVDWIHLAQDAKIWRPFLKRVTSHCVVQNAGNFLTSRGIPSSSRRNFSIDLASWLVCFQAAENIFAMSAFYDFFS